VRATLDLVAEEDVVAAVEEPDAGVRRLRRTEVVNAERCAPELKRCTVVDASGPLPTSIRTSSMHGVGRPDRAFGRCSGSDLLRRRRHWRFDDPKAGLERRGEMQVDAWLGALFDVW
jgi:hypothetical protein